MERKLSTKKYLIAFILTLVVFSGGILVGLFFENVRLSHSQQINLQEKTNLISLQLQQQYIGSGIADCKALNNILELNIVELGNKVETLSDYGKRSVLNDEDFKLQLRDYFLTELQFLFVSNEIDTKCTSDHIKVLFFYDENQNDIQGEILDYVKDLFGSRVLIFSFDPTFADEPMINVLLASYNIEKFPAVVVGSTVFQGPTSLKTLLREICSQLVGELPKECKVVASS